MTSPSASPEIGPWRRARPLLGTYVEITLDAPGAPYPAQAFETAFAEIGRIHHLMSWHAPDSDVGRINRTPPGHWLDIDPCTAAVLHTARMLWQRSGGLFDITCERHLRACGVLPADSSGRAVARSGGMADLELDDGARVRLHRPLTVNLDGIAKGYAVDRAVAVLQAQGVRTGCVNALYLTLTGLGVTGLIWMGIHYANGGFAGENRPYALLHQLMIFHGVLGYLMAVALGLFLAQHVGAGWRARRSRATGISLLALFATLMASALVLYYSGDDTLRTLASLSHQIVGVGLVLAVPAHVVQRVRKAARAPAPSHGHRQQVNAPHSANSPTA